MRTNQGIFRAVIKAGFYAGLDSPEAINSYMCNSLRKARLEKVITEREYDLASAAIPKYMDQLNKYSGSNSTIMWHALRNAYPDMVQREDMVELYKNWNKRP
jgi:hypothetical protein